MSTSDDFAATSTGELLRDAIRHSLRSPETAKFELAQLWTALVVGDTELEAIWHEEASPEQAEIDIHLSGPDEDGANHFTRADQFSHFIGGINDATKALVRERLGLRRLDRNLVIAGATPGSVRVVMRASAPPTDFTKPMDLHGQFASSPDSEALRTIARLLTNASEEQPAIGADVRDLPPAARKALVRSVKASRLAGWEISGQIRQRGLGSSQLRLSLQGAAALESELKVHQYASEIAWFEGRIDGFRRSLGSFYFEPIGVGRTFAVNVPDAAVLSRAALLAATEGVVVRAQIETVRAIDEPGERSTTGRVLLNIQASAQGTQAEITQL